MMAEETQEQTIFTLGEITKDVIQWSYCSATLRRNDGVVTYTVNHRIWWVRVDEDHYREEARRTLHPAEARSILKRRAEELRR